MGEAGDGERVMILRVSGKNLEIGEAFRSHIEARIDSALAKHGAKLVAGHVTVEPEGSGFRADCALHLSSGAMLQADAKAHDPYATFNRAADLIENQVRRHRGRLLNHHPGAAASKALTSEPRRAPPAPSLSKEKEGPSGHPAVIAELMPEFKRMTVSAAAMELDSTNAQIVVFGHASDGRTNIVYRRPDGNIGWIDPGRK